MRLPCPPVAGGEFSVFPDLCLTNTICYLDYFTVEWHMGKKDHGQKGRYAQTLKQYVESVTLTGPQRMTASAKC